jgi:hypothetical protein
VTKISERNSSMFLEGNEKLINNLLDKNLVQNSNESLENLWKIKFPMPLEKYYTTLGSRTKDFRCPFLLTPSN